ncbi:MAG: AAA family ATPase [Acidobacteria bacterium]|nr:AAA family ATPase [Acidobacteriota bacterium]
MTEYGKVSNHQRMPSIAVLPFTNISGNPEQEYFCDGVAEEIASNLSKLQTLRVISRGSTRRMKGTQKNIQTIGRELGVRYVVQGSVLRGDTSLRIAAQLINTEDGNPLRAEQFDGEIPDIFDLQEKIARSVVQALNLTLSPEEDRRLGAAPFDDVQAYECYLKAQSLFSRTPDRDSLTQVLDLLNSGLAIIGDNDGLCTSKGLAYTQSIRALSAAPDTYAVLLQRAQWCATKSFSINVDSAAAQYLQACIFMQRGKPRNAIKRARKALELDPNHAGAAVILGYLLAAGGSDPDSALQFLEKAAELDPLTPEVRGARGFFHIFQGDFRAAAEALKECQQEMEITNSPSMIFAVWLHALSGNYGEAIRLADRVKLGLSGHIIAALASFFQNALHGEKAQALAVLTPQLEEAARWNEIYSLMMAEGYALLGEHDAAFPWLERAIDYGIMNIPFLSLHDGLLASLRSDARFTHVIEKVTKISAAGGPAVEMEAELFQLFSTEPLDQQSPPTVGREREHAALRSVWDKVTGGRGLLLAIGGEPGLGKTTLVEEFLSRLADDGERCRIGRGRCSERLTQAEPYYAVFEALRGLLRGDQTGSLTEILRRVAPIWHALITPLKTADAESTPVKTASRQQLKREFIAFLNEVSRSNPIILFLDDMHWVDSSTADLLAHAAGRLGRMRCLIITTYRPSALAFISHPFGTLMLEWTRRGIAQDLALGFLSRDDIVQYLSGEFSDHRFPNAFADVAHTRTGGNPLFTVELLRYLRDRGTIMRRDGCWTLNGKLADIERDLPESLPILIQKKLEQLSNEDQWLLAAASVQGNDFDSAIVTQSLGMNAAEVEEHLNSLERLHSLVRSVEERPLPSGKLNLRYRFVHELYQNSLYDGLTASRREALSKAVAESLESEYVESHREIAASLALLFETARDHEKAVRFYALAIENAKNRYGKHEITLLAQRGVEMFKNLPEGSDTASLRRASKLLKAAAKPRQRRGRNLS